MLSIVYTKPIEILFWGDSQQRKEFNKKQSLLNTKDQKKNTADIWFIKDQSIVLVPTFFDNRIIAYKLMKED